MGTDTIIALVALTAGVLGPAIGFYASVQVSDARLTRAEADIIDLNRKHDDLGPVLSEIRAGLARIEGRLERKGQ